eukprot:CAMPEP_0113585706 /NCGR_PEP_ID=MMETSP0015_2-20120614/33860_1 /TAXON_ID=2838 /ORGANISM="Odontella" /LENGTH=53 /DNA_ID=CAMNT_0000491001 /DNA_START=19 /DNA_END=177 /DNA_ORIENTATION=+ /assembly_acc=CAM_ASM_000160
MKNPSASGDGPRYPSSPAEKLLPPVSPSASAASAPRNRATTSRVSSGRKVHVP